MPRTLKKLNLILFLKIDKKKQKDMKSKSNSHGIAPSNEDMSNFLSSNHFYLVFPARKGEKLKLMFK